MDFFLQSNQFSVHKEEALLSFVELKILFSTFAENDLRTLIFLNQYHQNA